MWWDFLCLVLSCSVPSQCIQSRTIGNPKSIMSVTTKIALQLNCKLGGELWALEIPVRGRGKRRQMLTGLLLVI